MVVLVVVVVVVIGTVVLIELVQNKPELAIHRSRLGPVVPRRILVDNKQLSEVGRTMTCSVVSIAAEQVAAWANRSTWLVRDWKPWHATGRTGRMQPAVVVDLVVVVVVVELEVVVVGLEVMVVVVEVDVVVEEVLVVVPVVEVVVEVVVVNAVVFVVDEVDDVVVDKEVLLVEEDVVVAP